MPDSPMVPDLAAHAARIMAAQDKHNQAMAAIAAENANPVPLTPEPKPAA